LIGGVRDLFRVSPRRLFSMSRLSFRESVRVVVLVAVGIFVAVLLFGGWFLDVDTDRPARVYLSFVLTTTTYLMLVLALFLSTFSIPSDIKNRTIYTVVTKPVLAWEIVLGRILGFTALGTILLAAMCLVSYIFVVRGVSHSHTVDAADVEQIAAGVSGGETNAKKGRTSSNARHRHDFTVNEQGKGSAELFKGHWHKVKVEATEEGEPEYLVGPPEDMLQARIPIHGKLRYLNKTGRPGKGTNVGKEWTYRRYIEGGTLAAAVWTFEGVTPQAFPDGELPLELNIRIFRTHKGDIEKRISGTVFLKNPDKHLASQRFSIAPHEFASDRMNIPRQLKSAAGDDIDLFEDLVSEGRIEVWLRCTPPGQYFGVAEPDVYLRAADGWFWTNFIKGYISIWLQMVLVISFGVMFSTFLSGVVAMLTALVAYIMGFFVQFIAGVFESVFNPDSPNAIMGGGPLESAYRLVMQMNVMTELEPGVGTTMIKSIDWVLMLTMRLVSMMLPDFSRFTTADFIADGYFISANVMAQHTLITMAYVMAVATIGYYLLRTREIAA